MKFLISFLFFLIVVAFAQEVTAWNISQTLMAAVAEKSPGPVSTPPAPVCRPATQPTQPGQVDPFERHCRSTEHCPLITVTCLTPAQIEEEVNPGTLAACSPSTCEMLLNLDSCAALKLKSGQTIKPTDYTEKTPTTMQEAYDSCTIRHEMSHANYNSDTCPACGNESISASITASCLKNYHQRFCVKEKKFSRQNCAALLQSSQNAAKGHQYHECLCNNRIPGTYDTYKKGTCGRCLTGARFPAAIGASYNIGYCAGKEEILPATMPPLPPTVSAPTPRAQPSLRPWPPPASTTPPRVPGTKESPHTIH